MKKQYLFSLLLIVIVGFVTSAQQLVSDINTSGGSDPNFFTEYDGLLFFSADDGINGRELWAYDPNTQTSSLILDINPGAAGSDPSGLYVYDGKLVFGTDYNTDLVVYDRQVSPATVNTYVIGAGSNRIGNQPRHYTELNGDLYFAASFGLYRFNGSAVEFILINNRVGALGTNSYYVTKADDKIYIDGQKTPLTSAQYELFFFDPSDNTSGLIDIGTGATNGAVQNGLTVLSSNRLIMAGRIANNTSQRLVLFDPVTSAKSYISDGGFSPTSLKALDNSLYYQGGLTTDREFYRYEPGTGPTINIDINPSGSSNPAIFTEFNGNIFFRADDGVAGTEMHYYNHASGEHGRVFDLNTGAGSSTPKGIIEFNNELYFGADDGSGTGFELWKYDGSLPCPIPTNPTVSNISFFDADISWTGSADAADGYQWYVMAQGEVPNQGGVTPVVSGSTASGTTTASVTGLNFSTNYDVYVEALCSITSTSSLSSVASFTTLSCQSPTNLATSNITDSSVTATWTASATAFDGYNWYLMNPGEVPGTDTALDFGVVTNTSVNVTGLTAATSYDLYIQSKCVTGSLGGALNTFESITTTASCAAPTSIIVSNISASTLDLSWTASTDATNGYRWYILSSGSTDTAQAIETNTTTNTTVTGVNASNLVAGTSYDAYVVSRCSATVNSGLSLVETFTMPSALPLITLGSVVSNVLFDESLSNNPIITLSASQQATQNIDVTLAFSGSASYNSDYSITSNTVTIPQGASSYTLPIPLVDDNELEAIENIIIDIVGVVNGVEDGVQQTQLLIQDNESSNISFTDSGQTLVTLANDVVLGDFDNNTGLDALFAKANFSDRVFFNNGSGVLSNSGQTLGLESSTLQMAVGDFDGSGGNYVVLAKGLSCDVLLNDSGIYSQSVTIGSGNTNNAVEVDDIDFDGLDDIIVGKVGEVEIYINDYVTNNFMLGFSLSQTLSFGTSSSTVNDMKISDFNQDNNLDLVIATLESSYVFYGTGGGQFNATAIVLPNEDNASGVDVFDIDNNGFEDFVFAQNFTNHSNQIVLNNGSNGFSLMSLTPRGAGTSSTDVAFVDLDNDNDMDVVFSNTTSRSTFWENIGGIFADNEFVITNNTFNSKALDVGDIDGDGDMDVIFANGGSTSATSSRIWFNDLQSLSNNDFDAQADAKLYPNPVKNQFTIDTQNSEIEKVEVFNLQGMLVKTFKASEGYSISDLESGLYFVSIQSNRTISTVKILKE